MGRKKRSIADSPSSDWAKNGDVAFLFLFPGTNEICLRQSRKGSGNMATRGRRGKHSNPVASSSGRPEKANVKHLKCHLDFVATREREQERPEGRQEKQRAGIALVLEVLSLLTKGKTGNKHVISISHLNQAILQRDSTFRAKKYGYKGFKVMLKDMQAQGLLVVTATSTSIAPKQRRSLASEGGGSDCLQPASKKYDMPEYDLHHFGRM